MTQSQKIIEQAANEPKPAWLKPKATEAMKAWATKIHDQSEAASKTRVNNRQMHPVVRKDMVRVFLTLGDDDQAAREQFHSQMETLAGIKNVVVELRGLPKGIKTINALIKVLHEATEGIKDPPPIDLAPKRFLTARVATSPTVIFYRADKPIARLSGSLEVAYLRQRVKDGYRGKQGVRGQTVEVAEVSLMKTIRKRWAKIDWAKEKKHALAEYWEQYNPPTLPQATKPRTYTVDPTVVVARNFRTPAGKLFAYKGERINPLKIMPFTGRIIAFNGSVPAQVTLVKKLVKKTRAQNLRPILVTTGFPAKPGFNALDDLEKAVNGEVYLLRPILINRFKLKHLPSTVSAPNGATVFTVKEIPPGEGTP